MDHTTDDSNGRPARAIRSFTRRAGRTTPSQQRARTELWPHYGLDPEDLSRPPAWTAAFPRAEAPRVLDIGFGDGEALLQQAQDRPDWDFLGIEVHPPGIGHLLQGLSRASVDNVRILEADVARLLHAPLPPAQLDQVQVFFPDPWPKKRHHKRRLVQRAFLEVLTAHLRPGGFLHLATDWPDYADQIARVLAADGRFVRQPPRIGDPRFGRPLTKYEQRGTRRGHPIWDRVYRFHPRDPFPIADSRAIRTETPATSDPPPR